MKEPLKNDRIEANLRFIKSWMFEKTYDSLCEYSADSDLYFMPFEARKYLVLNHSNVSNKIELQGFDLWISEYDSTSAIGKRKAISMTSVKHGFNIHTDKMIIDNYLTALKSL